MLQVQVIHSAAVVYNWLNGMSTEDILIAGMVNAKKTIETKYTVRQNLDQQQLYHDMEDYKNGKFTKYIEYSREVQQARENNQPIVSIRINNYIAWYAVPTKC